MIYISLKILQHEGFEIVLQAVTLATRYVLTIATRPSLLLYFIIIFIAAPYLEK